MSIYLPLLLLLALLVFGVVMTSYKFKNDLSAMKAMMIPMSLGMIIGLDFGCVLAMIHPDSLFKVTAFAILAGSATGFLSGLPLGIVPVLNGFMSGAMGGMMGAMLGTMFPFSYINDAVEILAILSAVIIFILFLMLQEEFRNQKQKWLHVIGKPETIFLVIALFLFIAHQTSFKGPITTHHGQGHAAQEPANISISAAEFGFTPNEFQVKAGQKIIMQLKNDGKLKHQFKVEGTDFEFFINPGETEKISITFNQQGTYKVYCNIPGHEKAGLYAEITVY